MPYPGRGMSQPPPPPRRRNAPGEGPIVVYPGSPPPTERREPDADIAWSADRPSGGRASADRPSGGGPSGGRPTGPSGPSRAYDDTGGRRRWLLLGGGLLAILAIAGGVLALAGGGGDGKAEPKFEASTSVDLQAGTATIESVGFPIEFPPEVRDQLLSTMGAYVDRAIVTPLRKGKADEAQLAEIFDAPAAARLTTPERGVLVDEGYPLAVGKIKVTSPPVPLTALIERDGKLVLAATGIDLQITARAEKGTIKIHRVGSLVYVPDGAGGWKITAWTLSIERSGPGVTVSTTTPTTAPPT